MGIYVFAFDLFVNFFLKDLECNIWIPIWIIRAGVHCYFCHSSHWSVFIRATCAILLYFNCFYYSIQVNGNAKGPHSKHMVNIFQNATHFLWKHWKACFLMAISGLLLSIMSMYTSLNHSCIFSICQEYNLHTNLVHLTLWASINSTIYSEKPSSYYSADIYEY